ncbi:hypothetical protein M8C13_17825 [Crossiella sp. SN42]|uniref:hypothetical protein n=1 Tax=Crossiella sp. SN42 TaxID=2944808 RepID=UPI00207C4B13|nr:hypothetical protein [Crossiella sp. SN42]MCO1577620.1 hypothetical protein [Crossiella sp. SN42]
MPKQLRVARVVIIIQAVLNLALGGLALVLLSQESERAWERGNLGVQALLLVVSLLAMVLLLVCVTRFGHREPWVRFTALGVEWVVVAGALLNIVGGLMMGELLPQAVIPLVFAALVLQALLRPESREWFTGELREWSGDQRQ